MKSVLIVDDVATNLICVSEVLKPFYNVSTAKSGRQALLMLQEMTPDLVILDVNMPQMNGYEVMEQMKQDSAWAKIPVIFLTAESDMVNEVKGLEMGAMDFIKKPFDPEVIKTRIDKILSISDKQNELEVAANKDSLTNLNTRKALENFLMQKECEKGYFLLLDLDNFKAVNDTYGHIVGDSVLVKMAQVFEEVVGENSCISRIGGDEFAIFLPGEFSEMQIRDLSRRLIATCEFEIGNLLVDYSEFKVSVSVGIASRPENGDSFHDLYKNADKALYYVKQNGKRGFYFYESMSGLNDEFGNENYKIDMLQLQKVISETEYSKGAYHVEYEGFKRIYRFVSRCMERRATDAQIVLFSLDTDDKIGKDIIDGFMDNLSCAVTASLRRGDVAARCGNSQYVVILMDADSENGGKVAERIIDKYYSVDKEKALKISYEMKSVKGTQ